MFWVYPVEYVKLKGQKETDRIIDVSNIWKSSYVFALAGIMVIHPDPCEIDLLKTNKKGKLSSVTYWIFDVWSKILIKRCLKCLI